jgi:hypothetical protein
MMMTMTISTWARPLLGAAVLLGAACGPAAEPAPPPSVALQAAPWDARPLTTAQVPAVYLQEWSRAENQARCPLLVPSALGAQGEMATPRRAQFGGGWGVAYDLPELRSAFGVAGTGAEPGGPTYDAWPHRRSWADGSRAGYGPEGGTGPNQLAYLELAGHDCLYNVWSRLGVEHLETLLEGLRLVAAAG